MIIIIIQLNFILLFAFISKKYLKVYFFIVAFILAITAFFFQPSMDMDLYRHYQTIESFKIYGWDFVKLTDIFKTLPVYEMYFYLISLLPFKGFLPAITVFITYFLLLNLIYKISKDNNIKKLYIMITFFFVMFGTDYLSIISGIRNMLAFSIFSYFLYIDLVEQKHKLLCFLIYIALCFLHNSVAILILFRILVYFYNRFIGSILKLVFLFWTFFFSSILNIVNIFSNSYFNILSDKANIYYVGVLEHSLKIFLFNLCILILLTLIFIIYNHENKNRNYYPSQYGYYMILTIVFTFGSVKQYELFLRMVAFIIFVSPYYILMFLDSNNTKNKTNEIISIKEKKLIANNYKLLLNVAIVLLSILEIIYRFFIYNPLIFKF